MTDINDMLDMGEVEEDKPRKNLKKQKSMEKDVKAPTFEQGKTKKTKGLLREVRLLHQSVLAPPLCDQPEMPIPVIEAPAPITVAPARRVNWEIERIQSSARQNDIDLYHWTRFRSQSDYRYAKFNKPVKMLQYTDEEYKFLEHPFWSRSDTDRLFELCSQFSLRFLIIEDRFNKPNSLPRYAYNRLIQKIGSLCHSSSAISSFAKTLKQLPLVIQCDHSAALSLKQKNIVANISKTVDTNLKRRKKSSNPSLTIDYLNDGDKLKSTSPEALINSDDYSKTVELEISADVQNIKTEDSVVSNSCLVVDSISEQNAPLSLSDKNESSENPIKINLNISASVPVVEAPKPLLTFEEASAYFSELSAVQNALIVFTMCTNQLDNEARNVTNAVTTTSAQFSQLPMLQNYQMQTLLNQQNGVLLTLEKQIPMQENSVRERLLMRVPPITAAEAQKEKSEFVSEEFKKLTLDVILSQHTPLTLEEVAWCMNLVSAANQTQVQSYKNQQLQMQHELTNNHQAARQRYEQLIANYSSLASTLPVSLAEIRSQASSLQVPDFKLLIRTLQDMYPSLTVGPITKKETASADSVETQNKFLVAAMDSFQRYKSSLENAGPTINVVKDIAAKVKANKLSSKRKASSKSNSLKNISISAELLKPFNMKPRDMNKPNKVQKGICLGYILKYGAVKIEDIKIVTTPQQPKYRLHNLSFLENGIPLQDYRVTAIIIPEMTDAEFAAEEEAEAKFRRKSTGSIQYESVSDGSDDEGGRKKRVRNRDVERETHRRRERENDPAIYAEWMKTEKEVAEEIGIDEIKEHVIISRLLSGDLNAWPNSYVTSEELKDRFYSVQRSLLILRSEGDIEDLLSSHPWFDSDQEMFSLREERTRKLQLDRFLNRTTENEVALRRLIEESKIIDVQMSKLKKHLPRQVNHPKTRTIPSLVVPPLSPTDESAMETQISVAKRKSSATSPISVEERDLIYNSCIDLLDSRALRLSARINLLKTKAENNSPEATPPVFMDNISHKNLITSLQNLGVSCLQQQSRPIVPGVYLQSQHKLWPLPGLTGNFGKQVETELEKHCTISPIAPNFITFHTQKIYDEFDALRQDAFNLLQLQKAVQKVDSISLQLAKSVESLMLKMQKKKVLVASPKALFPIAPSP